ncbi:dihydrofolate reductase family protein [Pseudonocardia sp.]|uniref:dihydrofolate reductase family protein n=1 Tax=Pseudonocardia sp. TaxID=60912 RepID=UPI0031FE3CF7
MANMVSTLFLSLDGVAEIAEDWHFPYFDENMGRAVDEDYTAADVLLLGRVTYDSFAGAWPDRESAGEDDAAFAKSLGDRRKIVASRTPLDFTWRNSELIEGELVEAVTALKADPGVQSILIPGSISVVQQLLAAGLIDELRLLVHPVAARSGKRLFDEGNARYHLRLLKSETFPTGVVRLLYAPAPAPGETTYEDVKGMGPGNLE